MRAGLEDALGAVATTLTGLALRAMQVPFLLVLLLLLIVALLSEQD